MEQPNTLGSTEGRGASLHLWGCVLLCSETNIRLNLFLKVSIMIIMVHKLKYSNSF